MLVASRNIPNHYTIGNSNGLFALSLIISFVAPIRSERGHVFRLHLDVEEDTTSSVGDRPRDISPPPPDYLLWCLPIFGFRLQIDEGDTLSDSKVESASHSPTPFPLLPVFTHPFLWSNSQTHFTALCP